MMHSNWNTMISITTSPLIARIFKRAASHSILVILSAIIILGFSGCSQKPLSAQGSVTLSARSSDSALLQLASTFPGLDYSERLQPEYWLQRYNLDKAAGTITDLYQVEWNREVFNILRDAGKSASPPSGSKAPPFPGLWKRTTIERRSPQWLGTLPYGPAQGFIPTGGYIWGLFTKIDKTASGSGQPEARQELASLEDVEQAFAKAAERGQTPIALGNKFGWPGAAWFTILDLRINGPEAVWERYEGKRPWNDKGAREVFHRLADWRDRGWFSPQADTEDLSDMIASVESGSAWCTLLGAYAIDRFPRPREISFVPFPAASARKPQAEIASLTGFLIPQSSPAIEAALALADAYILSGSPNHIRDNYRVPVASALKPVKTDDPIPEAARISSLTGLRAAQAQTMATASALVPAFDRAMPAQAVQDSRKLWTEFFTPSGPDGDSFADALQGILGRSLGGANR